MTDAYDSSLWDIDPACQVAAICDNDSVVLDGARGATIEWSKFDCVWYVTDSSWKRLISSCIVRFAWGFLFIGILFSFIGIVGLLDIQEVRVESTTSISIGNSGNLILYFYLGVGVFFLLVWCATVLVNPFLVRNTLAGKVRDIQGAFYGVEGYLNPESVERIIFGGNFGRFKWSPHGSLLSRSRINEHREKIGIDPCVDPDTREKIGMAKVAKIGDMRVSHGLLLLCHFGKFQC